MDKLLQEKLIGIAQKQINHSIRFKQPRLNEIKMAEDMYANKMEKQLKNRFNVPLPILGGFVDALKAKIDDAPIITFNPTDEADYKVSKKVTALWQREKADDRGRWEFIDRMVKILAIFSGRGIYKYYATSDPRYKSCLEVIDYYDFLFEPRGGSYLENHLFVGQTNIFRSKADLENGAEDGLYEKSGVAKLISGVNTDENKKIQAEFESKNNRLAALNLIPEVHEFVGEELFNLTEWCLTYGGKRYYLFFDHKSGISLRASELKEVFKSDLYPFASWATHEDPFNFFSKAPVDDIRPIAEAMRIVFNQALDNVQKRNWGQRAFDKDVFEDPSQLIWKPDGLVQANGKGGDIRRGIFTFETPDNTTITINLMDFLDGFLGQKTGITPSAQGVSDKDAKVGVYYGDMQQVADRIGVYNKAYRECWADLGKRFVYGLKEHLIQPEAVKIIGINGVEWDEIKKSEINEFNVTVTGGSAEVQLNEVKKQKQGAALDRLLLNPALVMKVNQNWLIENILKDADYPDDEIKRAMDTNNEGDQEIMSEAAQAIEEIITGKKPKLNRGATTAFMKKIVDYAYDNEMEMPIYNALIQFAMAHTKIATENIVRKAKAMASAPIAPPTGKPNNPIPANTEAGTAAMSQNLSNQLTPAYGTPGQISQA